MCWNMLLTLLNGKEDLDCVNFVLMKLHIEKTYVIAANGQCILPMVVKIV